MGVAILIVPAAIAALICAAAGLSKMPLHRRSFSAMTQAERRNYRSGLLLALLPLCWMLPLLLLLFFS